MTGGEDSNWVSDVAAADSSDEANVLVVSTDNQVGNVILFFQLHLKVGPGALTIGERITVRLGSKLTRLDLTKKGKKLFFVCSEADMGEINRGGLPDLDFSKS